MARRDLLLRYAMRAVLLAGFALVGWLLGTSSADAAQVQPVPGSGSAAAAVTSVAQAALPPSAPSVPRSGVPAVTRTAVARAAGAADKPAASKPSAMARPVRPVARGAVAAASGAVATTPVAAAPTVVQTTVEAVATSVAGDVRGVGSTVPAVVASTVSSVASAVVAPVTLPTAAAHALPAASATSARPDAVGLRAVTGDRVDGATAPAGDTAGTTPSPAPFAATLGTFRPGAPAQPGQPASPRQELAALVGVGASSWTGAGPAFAVLAAAFLLVLAAARTAFPRSWTLPGSVGTRPCFSPD